MKKILPIIIILVFVVISGFFAFKFLELEGENLIEKEGTEQTEKISPTEKENKVNDEIFVEVMARTTSLNNLAVMGKIDADEAEREIEDIYKKYNVTKDEVDAYGNSRSHAEFSKLFERMGERIIEPQEEYESKEVQGAAKKLFESKGKMNDDIYVELFARNYYLGLAALGGEISEDQAEKRMDEFCKEYGVTKDDYKVYGDALSETKKGILDQQMILKLDELDESDILGK